ncbi:MAG: hypothetical protein K2L96_03035 [Muribaculaceae bacterium]|nr:hypothetical protein [Muribaculaceae bacterium]
MKKTIISFAVSALLVGGFAVSFPAIAAASTVETTVGATKVVLVKFIGNMVSKNTGYVEERDGKLYVTGMGETNIATPCSRGDYNYCVVLGNGTWYFSY